MYKSKSRAAILRAFSQEALDNLNKIKTLFTFPLFSEPGTYCESRDFGRGNSFLFT